ncbi:MAG TPA: esterase-like activity of phytase family protein [Chloroflexota bacterium]|nr:esterase-like activity of phytase family protein [Chloroflexota bacterium]
MRAAAGFAVFIGAWLLTSAVLVSAQTPPNVLSDALLTLVDLPAGYRSVSAPVQDQFPPIPGLETRNVGFERDQGPVGVVSSIARATDAGLARDVFHLMIDESVANGVQSSTVPLLGDEAAGLTAPPSNAQTGVAQRYMFRKDGLIVMVTMFGPTGSVSLDDALALAIITSARVDKAILAGASTSTNPSAGETAAGTIAAAPTSTRPSAPEPTAAPPRSSSPAATPTPTSRPPVQAATIASEATFDAPMLNNDIRMGGFSGIAALDTSGKRFAIVTDRGPNVFFRDRKQAVFAVPQYSPRILMVTLDGDSVKMTGTIPLQLPDGYTDQTTGKREVSGISTGAHDGPGYTLDRERLPYDPNGVDSEGLARDPRDGTFWVAEEYGPSILHVGTDGTIKQRFVPMGLKLDAPGENVVELLPGVLMKRKPNRGFEGVAIAPDGSRVFAIMQSPLSNPDTEAGEASRVHRIVALDTSRSDNVSLEGVYLYLAEDANRVSAPRQDDIKVGDMTAVSTSRLLVAERDSREGGPHRMVYNVDISKATNVKSRESVSGKTLEQLSESELRKMSIDTVNKESVVDLAKLGFKTEKFEGLAIVDDTTLAITGDNDFGLAEADKNGEVELTSQPSRIVIVRLPKSIQ